MTDVTDVTATLSVVRVAPEAHSTLRVYAAQQGITIGEAAARAIRLLVGPACKLPGAAK